MMTIMFIFMGLISFSFVLTIFYWMQQKKLLKKNLVYKSKTVPKFDLIEVSFNDEKFNEYYEPKIIDIISNEEV